MVIDISTENMLIGLGIIIGFSVAFGLFTRKGFEGILGWAMIFTGFMVWAELIPVWILYLITISFIILIYLKLTSNRGQP